MRRLTFCGLFLLLLLASAACLPTEEEVDAVLELADAKVASTYRDLARERYSGSRPAYRKTTKELSGERGFRLPSVPFCNPLADPG